MKNWNSHFSYQTIFVLPSKPKVFPVRLLQEALARSSQKNERSKGSVDEGLAITHAIFRRGSQYHTKFGVPKIEVTRCSRFYPRVRHDIVA